MPISDSTCRNAKPKDKPYKLADEKGMFLLVNTNGSKYFRLKYRFGGKEKVLALGVYPDTTLKAAREKRDAAREQIANGIDPSLTRKIEKAGNTENTLKAIAIEFMASKQSWSASHRKHVAECFERDVFPWLGNRPINPSLTPNFKSAS